MKEAYIKLCQNIIFALIIISTIVAPLFFLPTTSEFFEFNKYTALLIIATLGYMSWAVKMLLEKRFTFTKTPLDIPILLFVATIFIATLASIDQFTSLIGSYSTMWPRFLPALVVFSLYFLAASNLKSKKQVEIILWSLLLATTVSAVISIFAYFGIYLPFEFTIFRSFSTLGLISRLALLVAFALPIAISFAIFSKNKSLRAVSVVVTLVLSFSLILINYYPAYIATLGSTVFLVLTLVKVKLDKSAQSALALIAVFVALLLVLRFVPQVAKGTLGAWIKAPEDNRSINLKKEITLDNKTSWDIASQAIGKRPLFGTGPGTFGFAYTQLKPRYINEREDFWSLRFEKPFSDFTEIVTTMGIVGTLAYLIFTVVILRFVWTLVVKSVNNTPYLGISASLIGALIAQFFAISSIATVTPFVIALALLATAAKATNENFVFDLSVEIAALRSKFAWFPIGTSNDLLRTNTDTKGAKSQILPAIFLLIVLVASVLLIRYQVKAYKAEYFYRQALLAARSNDGNKTVSLMQKAISANPKVDTYHRSLAQTTLNAALNISAQGDHDDQKRKLLLSLAQVAIDQGKIASGYQILPLRLPGISAANVANWETLALVYQTLIGSVNGADVHAINTLSQATSLDPQNPILHDRLGQLYERTNDKDLAQRKYEDSIIVKGDFGPAHYHLAKLLIDQKGDISRIVTELNASKRFLPEKDPAHPEIDTLLQTYNKQLEEAQNQATSPKPSPQSGKSPSPSPRAVLTPTPSATPSTAPSL